MLAKPGSGGGGSGRLRATASNRRKTAESPDDAIRKLSKQAANKRCADCTTKVRNAMTTGGIGLPSGPRTLRRQEFWRRGEDGDANDCGYRCCLAYDAISIAPVCGTYLRATIICTTLMCRTCS